MTNLTYHPKYIAGKFPDSGYKSCFLSYGFFLIISLLEFLYAYFIYDVVNPEAYEFAGIIWGIGTDHPDTESYILASNFLNPQIPDLIRTPVYPLIIRICTDLVGTENLCLILPIIQYVVFLISAAVLQKICCKYIQNKRIIFWTTVIYMVLPVFVGITILILTESLALSCLIFFIWFLIKHYPSPPTVADNCLSSLFLIFLIFLRPIFLYLIGIVIVYFILILIKDKKKALISFSAELLFLCVVIFCIGYYQHLMHRNYGIKSLTIVSAVNNYFLAKSASAIDVTLTDNEDFQLNLKDDDPKKSFPWGTTDYPCIHPTIKANPAEFERFINENLKRNPKSIAHFIYVRFTRLLPKTSIFWNEFFIPLDTIANPLIPNMIFYWVIMALIIIKCLRQIKRKKNLPLLSILFIMISLGITIVSVVGGMWDWDRLMLPGASAFLLIVGGLCNGIKLKSLNKNLL